MSDDELERFRHALRLAGDVEQVMAAAYALVPLEAKEKLLSIIDDFPDCDHDDKFVRSVWSEMFTRCYGEGSNVVDMVESLPALLVSFEPEVKQRIASDERFADPTNEIAYLQSVVKISKPTQTELHAAVLCMVMVGRYLAAPGELLSEIESSFFEQIVALEKKRDDLERNFAVFRQRLSVKKKLAKKETALDDLADAYNELPENAHLKTIREKANENRAHKCKDTGEQEELLKRSYVNDTIGRAAIIARAKNRRRRN